MKIFEHYIIIRGGLMDPVTLFGPYKGREKAEKALAHLEETIVDTFTIQPLYATLHAVGCRS